MAKKKEQKQSVPNITARIDCLADQTDSSVVLVSGSELEVLLLALLFPLPLSTSKRKRMITANDEKGVYLCPSRR